MNEEKPISSAFPFSSKYLEVHGSHMHYIDEGEGDPIVFLHGNPTSSYLWRNIIPYLTPHGRCIAPDLIGMGHSEKPDISYRFFDHVQYLETFIQKLGLSNITFVIHDWGSALGFHYAMRHEENVKGIAFMEAILKPTRWKELPVKFRWVFRLLRTPIIGWFMASVMNIFLKQLLPQTIMRNLREEEKIYYETPFPTIKSRKPIRQWPIEIPIEENPKDVYEAVFHYHMKLQDSELPKLLLYATPGALITAKGVEWCRHALKNIEVVNVGKGLHFIQEDCPHQIGEEIARWYQTL